MTTMTVTNSYCSYAAQTIASSSKSTTDYMNELAKLAPSVKFGVGNTFSTAKSGKTLTINPDLLEKMQADPEKEKEMKELIKGVETMTKLADSFNNAMGWKTVYRHGYIDENGNYSQISVTRNEQGYKWSEKFRKEQKENLEKMLEKARENAAERRENMEAIQENVADRGNTSLDLKA